VVGRGGCLCAEKHGTAAAPIVESSLEHVGAETFNALFPEVFEVQSNIVLLPTRRIVRLFPLVCSQAIANPPHFSLPAAIETEQIAARKFSPTRFPAAAVNKPVTSPRTLNLKP
jgi:hypothetical protein